MSTCTMLRWIHTSAHVTCSRNGNMYRRYVHAEIPIQLLLRKEAEESRNAILRWRRLMRCLIERFLVARQIRIRSSPNNNIFRHPYSSISFKPYPYQVCRITRTSITDSFLEMPLFYFIILELICFVYPFWETSVSVRPRPWGGSLSPLWSWLLSLAPKTVMYAEQGSLPETETETRLTSGSPPQPELFNKTEANLHHARGRCTH